MKVTQIGDEDDIRLTELKKKHEQVYAVLHKIEQEIRSIVYKYDTLRIDYSKRQKKS